MADTARLEAQIRSNESGAAQARAQAARLEAQAAGIRQEIAELERQLAELQSFKGRAESDTNGLFGQLQDKQRILSQLGGLQNVVMAQQLLDHISYGAFAQARNELSRSADDVTAEINRGIREIRKRIEELRSQLAALENQISAQYARAAQCDRNASAARTALRTAQSEQQG